MKKTEILDFNSFASFSELVNVNTINTIPLVFWALDSQVVIKHQLEKLEYVENTVILDDATLVGKYTIDTNGAIIFIVDKTVVESACQAQEYIVGFIAEYTTNNLTYSTPGTGVYNMVVERGKDGRFVTCYKQATTADIIKNIATLDANLDVNMTGGYIYKIFKDIIDCKKR